MAAKIWTDEQRSQALELYASDGPTAASEATGIPKSTIGMWAMRSGVRTVQPENVRAAVEAHSLRWAERRMELAHEIGSAAELALERVVAELDSEDGSARDAKDLATAMAILVDKAQLLTGGVTERTERLSREEREERLAKVLRAVQARAG